MLAKHRLFSALPALLLAFLTAVSPFASAEDGLISTEDLKAIERIVHAKVPAGKFKGLPLNTDIRRPLHVVGAGEGGSPLLDSKLSAETVTVANIFHEGAFYIGRIPLSKIVSASLLSAPFMPIADHTMLKFNFSADGPIELIAKINDTRVEPLSAPLKIKDVVMTIDGTEPRGQKKWNFLDAIRGRYTIAYRLVTVTERLRWFVLRGTPVEQTLLNLDAEEARSTLRLGIQKSHVLSFSTRYSLLRANCTNLALKLLTEANPLRARSEERFSPRLQVIRAFLDKIMPGEAITWFTAARVRLLGWVSRNVSELQADPEFENEMRELIKEYRRSVAERWDFSPEEKAHLLADLGLDRREEIRSTPKLFRKALRSYDTLLENEKNVREAEAVACKQTL